MGAPAVFGPSRGRSESRQVSRLVAALAVTPMASDFGRVIMREFGKDGQNNKPTGVNLKLEPSDEMRFRMYERGAAYINRK